MSARAAPPLCGAVSQRSLRCYPTSEQPPTTRMMPHQHMHWYSIVIGYVQYTIVTLSINMIISAMMGSSGQPQWPGRLLRQRGSSEDRAKPVVTLLLTAVTTLIIAYNASMQPHYGGTGLYIWDGATPNLEHTCFPDVNAASCPVQRIAARQRRSMQHVSQHGHQQPNTVGNCVHSSFF